MRTVPHLVILCRILLATACTQSSPPKSASGETGRYSTDSVQAHLTDHYVKLLRAQLTAKDPYQAQVVIYCEVSRIMTLLTNEADDPLEGQNRAVRLLKEAERGAFTPADALAQDRVDSALHGRVFDALVNCDSLAQAGVLGDTVMPQLKARRF